MIKLIDMLYYTEVSQTKPWGIPYKDRPLMWGIYNANLHYFIT